MKDRQLFSRLRWWDLAAVLALAALLAIYVNNLTGWMIFDDEGEYLYQVWRMTLGEVPYRDFLTPQLPAFLYTGLAVMTAAGKSLLAMRLATVGMAFATAIILYIAGRKHAGPLAGLISMALYLLHPDVFRETRIFRNEPLFLLLVTAGLVVATWTPGKGRRRNVALAGLLFGLATMAKLFGLLPAAGVSLWLFWEWWRRGRRPKDLALDALALAGPLFGIIGLVGLIFSSVTPEFLDLVLGHHLAQGSQLSIWEVLGAKAGLLRWYVGLYPVLLALAIVSAILGIRLRDARIRWAWQLVTVLAFAALSRELGQRHFMYLLPSFLLLAGWLLSAALSGAYRWPGRVVALAAIPFMVVPWMQLNLDRANWVDTQTEQVVAIIEERSEPGATILADDIGLAFYSQRPTTYSGAALSHGAVTSGQITGDRLIGEIVADEVRMVIVDESLLTGNHMVFLRDYPRFHRFLEANFNYEGPVRRDFQELAIWTHKAGQEWQLEDVLDIQYESGALFGDTMSLAGYSLSNAELAPGERLDLTLFWENEGPADNYWSVFVHLVSEDGTLIAQHDKVPYDGLYPPNQWWPGQVVDDDYQLDVPPSTPPGTYTLVIGMYDHLTGDRLALRTPTGQPVADDQISLPQEIRVAAE